MLSYLKTITRPDGNALIIAGDRPPNIAKIIQSVLGWHRANPFRDQGEIMIQGGDVRVVIGPSRIHAEQPFNVRDVLLGGSAAVQGIARLIWAA